MDPRRLGFATDCAPRTDHGGVYYVSPSDVTNSSGILNNQNEVDLGLVQSPPKVLLNCYSSSGGGLLLQLLACLHTGKKFLGQPARQVTAHMSVKDGSQTQFEFRYRPRTSSTLSM